MVGAALGSVVGFLVGALVGSVGSEVGSDDGSAEGCTRKYSITTDVALVFKTRKTRNKLSVTAMVIHIIIIVRAFLPRLKIHSLSIYLSLS